MTDPRYFAADTPDGNQKDNDRLRGALQGIEKRLSAVIEELRPEPPKNVSNYKAYMTLGSIRDDLVRATKIQPHDK
jgi:hypothetical protein